MKSSQLACGVAIITTIGIVPSVAHAEGNPKNGLSDYAFKQSALLTNPPAMAALASHKLTTATLGLPELVWQLHDPNARAALNEIVRCALTSSQLLSYTDPADSTVYTFQGELGLCQSTFGGNWMTGAATTTCRELVSACVISRVNVLQKSVPISIRHQFATKPTRLVPTETRYRESYGPMTSDPAFGDQIGSFDLVAPPGHEYFWQPAYVGTCDAGSVSLRPTDSTRCGTSLRVCDGLEGCLGPNSNWTLPPNATDATSLVPTLTVDCTTGFTCPSSGLFSVMTYFGPPPTYTHVGGSSPHVSYPATEAEAFAFREGAFYGNLFDPAEPPTWTCNVDPNQPSGRALAPPGQSPYCTNPQETIPYPHIYACYTAGVEQEDPRSGPAYINSRLCLTGDANCFQTPVQRCWTSGVNQGRCQWDSTDGVFYNCQGLGTDTHSYATVTTYLSGGITDLASGLDESLIRARDRSDDELATDETGGCSAGGSGGLASIVLALAFIVRRRQRA